MIGLADSTAELDPLVVEALRPIDPSGGGMAIHTELDRAEIDRQPTARRLGDVIERMPGVFMGGPPNENKDIRLRGLDKEFTRFELDGAQLPGGGEKREFQVNRLSPFSVGTLRIVRNPTARYESDGIAGRVQAESRAIPDTPITQLRVFGGSNDEHDGEAYGLNLFHGQRFGETFGANVFLDLDRQPLHKEKRTETFAADGELTEREHEFENKPTRLRNLMLDLAWFYDEGSIHLRPLYNRLEEDKTKTKTKEKLAKNETELEKEDEDKTQTTRGAQLQHEHRFDNAMTLTTGLQYYETLEDKEKDKTKFKVSGGTAQLDKTEREQEDKQDDILQFDTGLIIPVAGTVAQTLETGIRLRERNRFRTKDKVEIKPDSSTQDKTEAKDNYDLQERYYAAYVQDDIVLSERLVLTPGVRAEHVEREAQSGDGSRESRSFTDINPHLHLHFRATPHLTAFAAVSRTVNRPKFDELAPFVQEKGDRFTLGNPALEPAHSINSDLGVRWSHDGRSLAATAFHKRIEGVIEEVDTGEQRDDKDLFRVDNVGNGHLEGLELEARWDGMLPGLNAWGNISFIDSELTTADGVTRPFKEQPERLGALGFDYTLAATGTTFTVAGNYVGSLSKIEADKNEHEESRWSVDAGLRHPLADNLTLTVDALNLTDSEKRKVKLEDDKRTLERETTGPVYLVGLEARF